MPLLVLLFHGFMRAYEFPLSTKSGAAMWQVPLQTIGNEPVSMIEYSVVYFIVTWSICEM